MPAFVVDKSSHVVARPPSLRDKSSCLSDKGSFVHDKPSLVIDKTVIVVDSEAEAGVGAPVAAAKTTVEAAERAGVLTDTGFGGSSIRSRDHAAQSQAPDIRDEVSEITLVETG